MFDRQVDADALDYYFAAANMSCVRKDKTLSPA